MAIGIIERSAKGLFDILLPDTVVSDLNNPPALRPSMLMTNENTLNTPYKAGLVGGSTGFAISYKSSDRFGVQLYAVSGNSTKIFIRQLASGTWGDWRQIASTTTT